ncbi:MAG: hypothetical protein GX837_02640 [Methanomicrobiales archaeon]|nr:hypothetical protein [Methanomicrobiales archaeon]
MPADETARRRRQHPDSILEGIGLRPGSTFVDVGCGDGFFALPAVTCGREVQDESDVQPAAMRQNPSTTRSTRKIGF